MIRAPAALLAALALGCGAAREELRIPEPRDPEPVPEPAAEPLPPEPVPSDPPLELDRALAGAIPVTASADAAPAFREAYLRVLTDEPFRLVALRLDGACRAVALAPDRPERPAWAPGDVLRIGEAPGSDYRVGAPVACPVPTDAPPWQCLLFYEVGGRLREIPFQFVQVGASR